MAFFYPLLAMFLDMIADPESPSMREYADLPNPEAVMIVIAAIIALIVIVSVLTVVALHRVEAGKDDDQ